MGLSVCVVGVECIDADDMMAVQTSVSPGFLLVVADGEDDGWLCEGGRE